MGLPEGATLCYRLDSNHVTFDGDDHELFAVCPTSTSCPGP
jgi:hypothetical protein